MPHRPVLLAALLALAAGLSPARADVVHLTSGGVVRGDVVSETRAEVVVRTSSGTAVIPRREVESVEREATAAVAAVEAEYRARLQAIDARDPEARYALGLWLKGRGAWALARLEFEAAVALDADHRFAREELTAPAGRGRAAAGATPAALALAARPEVATALDALRGRVTAPIEETWRVLDGLDPTDRAALAGALREVARDLRRDHERLERRAHGLTAREALDGREGVRSRALARWSQARDEALASALEAEANVEATAERVARARAAWLAVDALQRRDLHGLLTLAPADARQLRDDLLAAERRLAALADALAARELDVAVERAATDAVTLALLAARGGDAEAVGALRGWEAALARRLRDEQVLAANAARGQSADLALRPTVDELEQVRLTNEHRMALGRPALSLALGPSTSSLRGPDDGVLGAADPTAEDGPGGPTTPGGENAADGVESARAAHDLWVASPAHHRNLLDAAWTTIRVRRDGARWTQRFSGP